MKNIFFVFILLFSFQIVHAQRPNSSLLVKISAKVLDELSETPLEYATATLFSAQDSSLVTGSITDTAGVFSFKTKPGEFYLVVEFISYESKKIENIRVKQGSPSLDLGNLFLSQNTTTLGLVEVRADKSEMQIMLDKRVFNVGNDLVNKGGSVIDLLDNVPSVSVDIEGNISLRGSGDVRILIDGKPSALVGLGNKNGLRSIPSNMIDKIEVITNPSARYEAEGMTGIINIVLRKDKKTGLNGSFNIGLGYPQKHSVSANLNYRTEDWNFFINYGLRQNNRPGQGTLFQTFFKNDTTFILDETRDFNRKSFSNNVRLGSNYYINKKNVLTASFTYKKSNQDNNSTTIYNDYLTVFPDNFIEKTVRTNDEIAVNNVLSYAFNYTKTFEQKKHTLSFDLQFQESNQSEDTDHLEQYFDHENLTTGAPNLLQRSKVDQGRQHLLLKVDYVKPFSKNSKLELGGQSSFRQIKNNYLVEELENSAWNTLTGVSNDFDYTEDIHAIYASYGNQIGQFSFLAGLRAEYSDVSTLLRQTEESNTRSSPYLFPSLHLTYQLKNDDAAQLSYSRRIRRPRFHSLNPFFSYSNARNFYSGNPNLDPQLTHSIELTHIKYWKNTTISSSIYYRHTDGFIQRIKRINTDGTTTTRPENLAIENAYGTEFTFSLTPKKWFHFSGDFNFYRSIIDGTNQGANLESDSYSWFARLTSKFTFLDDTDFQLKFNYRAPRETTQGSRKAMAFLDFGISRDILKKRGTLTLSTRDLFNSRKRRYTSFGENFMSEGVFQWRSRVILLAFNYRLNQNKTRTRGSNGGHDDGGGEY